MLITPLKRPTLRVSMFFLLSLLLAGPAAAADRYWDGDENNQWDVALNWSTGVPTNNDTVIFWGLSSANLSNNNTISGLTDLSLEITRGGVTISGNAIGLRGDGVSVTGSGTILNIGLIQPGDTTYSVGSPQTLTLNGVVSGAGGVAKAGGGTLLLTGANTYAGGTQLNGGTVSVGSDGNLGETAGGLTFNGGTLETTADVTTYRNVAIGAGGGTFDTNGNDLDSWGTLTGTGSLTVTGGGELGLGSTAGTFDGNLTVNNSTIRMTSDNSLGTTAGNLTLNGSTLRFGNSVTTAEAIVLGAGGGTINTFATLTSTLGGDISGAGALTTAGDGTLTLTGTNTYTGGTTVTAGTLQGDTGSLQGNITNNAAVVFDQAADGTYAGIMSGTGSLTKSGAGTLVLSGANTYIGGGTTVSAGTLQGSTTSLQGDILNNSTVIFTQSGTGTYTGAMSGTGSLIKDGGGTVILSGANTYTGGTTVKSGTLQGTTTSLQGDIVNNSTLLFNQDYEGTFSDDISGTGMLIKDGTGTLNLTGTNTYTGLTAVNTGILAVNGSIAGPVTVGASGTLGGTGEMGSVAVNGSLAPGNSIGTINTGSLAFNAGSVYEVEVDAAGNSDRTNVTGTVSLGNATLNVLAQNGTYGIQTDYLIIANDGADAITGTFGTINSNLAFLDPTVAYTGGDGNDVMLSLTRNNVNFSGVALTPNQAAVAAALDNAAPTAGGDMAAVITAVTGLSASRACEAYDQMGSAGLAAFYESDLSAATRYMKTVSGRLSTLLASADPDMFRWDAGPLLASADTLTATDAGPLLFGLGNAGPLTPDADWGVWGRGLGIWGDRSGRDVAEQYDFRITGVALGVDRRLTDHIVAGISIGRTDSDLNYDALDDSGTTQGWEAALYTAWLQGPWYVDTVTAYARNSYDIKRHITFSNIDRVAKGDFDGDVYSAYLESGYTCNFRGLTLHPLASFQLVHMTYDAYTETGAGALNLIVEDRDETSAVGSLGLRLAKVIKNSGGNMMIPEARIRWAHEFNQDSRIISAAFAGAPAGAGSFRVEGDGAVRDRLIVGTGITALFSGRISACLNYDAAIGEDAFDHACSAGLRVMW